MDMSWAKFKASFSSAGDVLVRAITEWDAGNLEGAAPGGNPERDVAGGSLVT